MAKYDFTLDDLSMQVKWLGDSIGLDDEPIIRLTDDNGRLCDTTPADLLAHPSWNQIDQYGRIRIENGLSVAGIINDLMEAAQ